MKQIISTKKAVSIEHFLQSDLQKDLYGEASVFRIIHDRDTEEAMQNLLFVANWFEHPHPTGRDHRGECDFTAIRLIPTLYECHDKLTEDVKVAINHFYLQRNFSSIYGSENHAIMWRVSRYLAAQFYRDAHFAQYGLSAKEVIALDTIYINEFINFRAKRGWGEFDSYGYSAEILLIINTLYCYCTDVHLKEKSRKMMDVILLDMIVDTKDGLYGGAHGRIYEAPALNTKHSGMFHYYNYYFGAESSENIFAPNSITLLSDYIPSPIVYEIEKNRTFPYENRERKHLHSVTSWREEILYNRLEKIKGSINKYTYLCEDYLIGSVNHQDDYPSDVPTDIFYAHHQQHEWELTFPGGTNHKIFTHHPADPGYHHIHNHWTGDAGCCCGTFYTNRNTALAIYHIKNKKEYQYINAYVPFSIFDEVLLEKQYLFFRYRNLYLFLYFHNDYKIVAEGEFADREVISDGNLNAVVCHVEYAKEYPTLSAFATAMKQKNITFDTNALTLSYDGTELFYHGNKEQGNENQYPYEKLYDSPYLQSQWGSGVIEAISNSNRVIYNFNG